MIARFVMHVAPKGFVRIRFFGFLANRRRRTQLAQCGTGRTKPPASSGSHSAV
jgi:hypothetical protein